MWLRFLTKILTTREIKELAEVRTRRDFLKFCKKIVSEDIEIPTRTEKEK